MTHSENIKAQIIEMGLKLWQAGVEPSARRIALELQMTHPNILHHFSTSRRLRNMLAAEAVKRNNSKIIVQLIGESHESVMLMSNTEKMKHLSNVRVY